jgi:hypothetical protein
VIRLAREDRRAEGNPAIGVTPIRIAPGRAERERVGRYAVEHAVDEMSGGKIGRDESRDVD